MTTPAYPWTRTSLRPLDDIPVPVLKTWQNDPALRALTMGFPFPAQTTTVENWLQQKAAESGTRSASYAIFLEDAPVGACFLDRIDWIHGTAALGIYVAAATARGSGVGYCATGLLLDFAFRELNLRRVSLDVLADNQAAIRLYERIGFTQEGRARAARLMGATPRDVLSFGLLAAEFTRPPAQANLLSGAEPKS